MPHPIRPPFPPGKGAFRVPLKPPQCKECDTAPSKSLPCVRGGVSRSADGGVVGANYVIKRPGGELYGSCTLQNQCAAARRPQISLRRVGAQFIPLQKRPRPRRRAAAKKKAPAIWQGLCLSFVVWELQLAQLGAAAAADILVVIGSQLFLGAAENAAGQVLLKNDLITVYINFNITVDVDAEGAAKLYRRTIRPRLSTFLTMPVDFMVQVPP